MKNAVKFLSFALLCLLVALTAACNTGIEIPDEGKTNDADAVQSTSFSGIVSQYPFYDFERLFPYPCANAVVEISSVGQPEFYAGMVTGADGEFLFDSVPEGSYEITIKKDDYYFNAPVTVNIGADNRYDAAISFKGDAGDYRKVFYVGTNAFCDLNADGVKDAVQYNLIKNKYGGKEWSLSINGKDFTEVLDRCDYPSEMYSVIDIDASDPILHLALNDYGPSDDYTTRIFEYDGENLKRIGWIAGVIENGNAGFGDVICCGDGSIITYTRLSVLQTWHAYERWILRDGELVRDERDYYYVIDSYGARLTTLSDLTVYTSPDENSETAIIPVRTPLHLTQTDDIKWIACETPGNQKYWILLDTQSHGFNVMNGNESCQALDLFDGICYAD